MMFVNNAVGSLPCSDISWSDLIFLIPWALAPLMGVTGYRDGAWCLQALLFDFADVLLPAY